MSYKVQKRRQKVKKYLIRGYSPSEIASKLLESYYVICNDIRVLKQQSKNELLEESKSLKDIVYQTKTLLEKYNQIEKKAWDAIDSISDNDPSKLAPLLNVLKNIHSDVSKLLLLVEPSKTVVNVNEFIQINIMPILKQVATIIETYVPEELRYKAVVKLEELVRKAEIVEKQYGKNA